MTPLPPDTRPERTSDRTLLTVIATAIIALSCILGFAYIGLWQRASEDLSRLLPATTRAYLQLPAPWRGMNQALRYGIWRDRNQSRESLRTEGYLAEQPSGDLAGLPLDTVRDILRSASSLEFALVPGSGADTMMAFVEIEDSLQRRRILSKLKPIVTSVDRHAGFRIESVKELDWHRYLGLTTIRPLLVDMKPWLVFAWGSPQGLEDLLDARVGGRYDAIHRRPGFVSNPAATEKDAMRLVIDATSAWRLVTAEDRPPPGGLVERIDLLTLESTPSHMTRLEAELSDAEFAGILGRSLPRHETAPSLPALGPSDALAVVTFRSPSLKRLLAMLRLLDFGIRRDLAPDSLPTGLSMALRTDTELIPDSAAEVALFLLPSEAEPNDLRLARPLVLLKTASPEVLLGTLATSWPRLFGEGFAHGRVRLNDGFAFVERPQTVNHRLESGLMLDLPASFPDPRDGIAWRLRRGIIEIAPDIETLLRYEENSAPLGASAPFLAQARALDQGAPVWLLLRSENLLQGGPVARLAESRIAPGTWLALSIEGAGNRLEIRSPVGLWTLLVAMAGASRQDFDHLFIGRLDPLCAGSYEAFCALYPHSVPCRPFDPGHNTLVNAMCAELGHRRSP